MRQQADTNQVLIKPEHIAVLAGGQQVREMLVFLMYRKLKVILRAEKFHRNQWHSEGEGKG